MNVVSNVEFTQSEHGTCLMIRWYGVSMSITGDPLRPIQTEISSTCGLLNLPRTVISRYLTDSPSTALWSRINTLTYEYFSALDKEAKTVNSSTNFLILKTMVDPELHANYIGKGFCDDIELIALQHPDAHKSTNDFKPVECLFNYVFKKNSLIIDLTEFDSDYLETAQAIARLFPPQHRPIVRVIKYRDWPDCKSISVADLGNLIDMMIRLIEENRIEAVWVHCQQGVGRTGTLISAYLLRKLIGQGKITADNFDEKLTDLVFSLRQERSPMFIYTSDQFDTVYQYGLRLLGIGKKRKIF